MIDIIYCPDDTPKIVIAAGVCDLPVIHTHGDLTEHACLKVADVDEDFPSTYPHTTTDSTVVNDIEAWHTYLETYIP